MLFLVWAAPSISLIRTCEPRQEPTLPVCSPHKGPACLPRRTVIGWLSAGSNGSDQPHEEALIDVAALDASFGLLSLSSTGSPSARCSLFVLPYGDWLDIVSSDPHSSRRKRGKRRLSSTFFFRGEETRISCGRRSGTVCLALRDPWLEWEVSFCSARGILPLPPAMGLLRIVMT